MKTLLLLRHAKSSRDDPSLDDHERPLTDRGKKNAKQIGRLIQDEKIIPDLIVSSDAVRARKTAAKAAKQFGYSRAIELTNRLYLATVSAHYEVVQGTRPDCSRLMIVGHNPGLSNFFNQLTGSSEEMSTGALALIEFRIKNWKALSPRRRGKLIAFWEPQELS